MSPFRWSVGRLLAALPFLVACPAATDLDAVTAEVRERYPEVRQLATAELAAWLDDPSRPAPVLLDVREPEEFAVSHLAGARQVAPGDEVPPAVLALDRATPVVVYCSVGLRSSRFARALERAGFAAVWNLEGSIFAWANEERPLVRGEGDPVDRVHPYDRAWGRLVEPEHRAAPP